MNECLEDQLLRQHDQIITEFARSQRMSQRALRAADDALIVTSSKLTRVQSELAVALRRIEQLEVDMGHLVSAFHELEDGTDVLAARLALELPVNSGRKKSKKRRKRNDLRR